MRRVPLLAHFDMLGPKFKKQFVRILLGTVAIVICWLVVDAPVEEAETIAGVVVQSAPMSTRYSGETTRITVRTRNGTVLVFQRYGNVNLKPGMNVSIKVLKRRFSKLRSYDLQI